MERNIYFVLLGLVLLIYFYLLISNPGIIRNNYKTSLIVTIFNFEGIGPK